MPSKAEYRAAVEEVKSLAEKSPAEIVQTIEEEDSDSHFTHIVINLDNHSIIITGGDEMDYFLVRAPFDLKEFLATGLDSEKAEMILDGNESEQDIEVPTTGDIEEETLLKASAKLLGKTDNESLEKIQQNVNLIVPTSNVTCELNHEEGIGFVEFVAKGYLYPYESEFSLRHFTEKAQEVCNAVDKGGQYIEASVYLQHPEDSDSDEYSLKISS